jgi:hypothetical protein
MTKYRVYLAPDGSDLSYCGECESLPQARDLAARQPAGVEASIWATLRAAGGTSQHHAPDPAGVEEDEPTDWVGDYCVIRTEY